jgi:hypothetical protein
MDYKFLPERNKKDETDAKNSPARKKILGKKKATRLSRAKVKRIKARRIGAEAAYQQFDEQERCRDLSSKFARQSAERTGDPIGDIRERYDAIALGFVAVRQQVDGEPQSLISFLLREKQSTDAIKAFFATPGKWLGEDLVTACAEEFVRDRDSLMQFLLTCLKRWRKLDEAESRARFVTHQLAERYGHNRKRIAEKLLERGVIHNSPTNENEWNSLLSQIGQWLSRDQRKAVKDGFGPRERLKPASFGQLLHRPSEFAVRRNV